MKQLNIFCSRDLERQVITILDRADLDGFLRVGDATGHRFLPKGETPRSVTWEAVVIVVPGAEGSVIDGVVAQLRGIAEGCEVEACLRLLVTTACEVY